MAISAFRELSGRLGRHAAVYVLGAALSAAIALTQVAVVTRFLAPDQYGRLGVLVFFAELLAVVYDLGILQGTMRAVFAPGAGSAVGEDTFRRRAMGTSVLITLLTGSAGTALVVWQADWVAHTLLGQRADGTVVIYAAVLGALTATFRLAVNQLRFERRPLAYVLIVSMRGLIALALAAVLLSRAPTVGSVLKANVAAVAFSVGVAIAATRRLYSWRPSLAGAREVWRLGIGWVPVAISLWLINASGVFILSQRASSHTVGIFRAGAAVAAIASYATGAFYMAWGPLSRESIYQAARLEVGTIRLNRAYSTLYAIAALTLVFSMAILERQLIKVAGSRYASAAPLVPLLALPPALYGFFRLVYFTSTDPRRIAYFRRLCVAGAVMFVALATFTVPALGPYGIALAHSLVFALAAGVLLLMGVQARSPFPLDANRVLRAAVVGALCLGVARAASTLDPGLALAINVLAVLALPVGLVGAGAVPMHQIRVMSVVARTALRPRAGRRDLEARLAALDHVEITWLRALLAGRSTSEVALNAGKSDEELLLWFTRCVTHLAGIGHATPADDALARHLLARVSIPTRDASARSLVQRGVEPSELDRLTAVVESLRRLPARKWRAAMRAARLEQGVGGDANGLYDLEIALHVPLEGTFHD